MSERVISEWPVNARETMRVRLDQFQGQNIVDIRRWYSSGGGELKPGRGGLTIGARHLPELAKALARALAEAEAAGLLVPAKR
jgi:Transcriptional Coactivator p15 (PC4)